MPEETHEAIVRPTLVDITPGPVVTARRGNLAIEAWTVKDGGDPGTVVGKALIDEVEVLRKIRDAVLQIPSGRLLGRWEGSVWMCACGTPVRHGVGPDGSEHECWSTQAAAALNVDRLRNEA